jgi:hypothetical protein
MSRKRHKPRAWQAAYWDNNLVFRNPGYVQVFGEGGRVKQLALESTGIFYG